MSESEVAHPVPLTPSEAARATRNPLRKLYFWTLHWADTQYALPALFIISFAESSFFPIPPDVLLIAMCFSKPQQWWKFAFWCTIASVLGGMFGWWLGMGFWHLTEDFFFRVIPGFKPEVFALVQERYNENAFLAIVTAAFPPIPYKVFTVASGVFGVPLLTVVLGSLLGRGLRFFFVSGLIRASGPKIKPFLEKHFEIATAVLAVIGIGGFFALKFLR